VLPSPVRRRLLKQGFDYAESLAIRAKRSCSKFLGVEPMTPTMPYALRCISLAVVGLFVLAGTAVAQNYPEYVVRIINPFPAGGSVDVTGRILAQKLSENIGGQFILENRAGAGGNIGAEAVAKSAPDGYTLLYSTPGPLVVNHRLYAKGLPYDPTQDFEPIAVIVRVPMVLLINPKLPVTNVQELVELARKQPGTINFGSPGIGSANHLSGELFKSMAKINLTHVPYKGSAPAMADLLGGHIQMMFDAIPANLQNITSGAVRALGNAGTTRPAMLSEVPTIAEQGLTGFDSFSWFALVARRHQAPHRPGLRARHGGRKRGPRVLSVRDGQVERGHPGREDQPAIERALLIAEAVAAL
jgi:tripartite-type tricarboxylate transporter receptor subunit TctC